MEIYKLKHTGPDIDASLDALGDNGVELTSLKEQVAQISEDISSGIGATNIENGAGEKSLQATGIAEASGINAVALGGLRYDYFAYKYSWEFSVQLPNSKYSTHYGYYYKNTEEEYATVSSADSTNISDQQIVEGGKYITPFGDGNTEYTTSLTSAVIAEDGTIVSAPIITFTDVEGNVYTADMVESPYLGRIKTTAAGNQSFAAGGSTCAYGDWSVAFGKDTAAYQKASFAEGGGTIAGDPEGEDTYSFAHAEGEATKATGRSSHSEGSNTQATGTQAHAENYKTVASGQYSHAEGSETTAANKAAHAEGYKTTASGAYSHAEGNTTEATGISAHAEGNTTHAVAEHAHAEGFKTTASGANSHAEGYVTTASGESAHAEGLNTKAIGNGAHAEGYLGEAAGLYSHVEGQKGEAKADYSHVEGDDNTVEVDAASAHAEGTKNTVSGAEAHVEGRANTVSGARAHAEGASNTVSGECSHVEGNGNKVLGAHAHAEGGSNEVHGGYGHAEGNKNISKNWFSHVEGSENQALHSNSHVGGKGNISGQNSQTVIGEYNKVEADALFVVGNGEKVKQEDGSYRETRRNAFVLSKTGKGMFADEVTSAGKKLITDEDAERIAKEEVETLVAPDVSALKGEVYGRKNLFDTSRMTYCAYDQGNASFYTGSVSILTSEACGGCIEYKKNAEPYNYYDLPATPLTDFCDIEIGKTYTLSCKSNYGELVLYSRRIKGGESATFVATQELIDGGIGFSCFFDPWEVYGTNVGGPFKYGDCSYSISEIMLVEGDKEQPYVAYGEEGHGALKDVSLLQEEKLDSTIDINYFDGGEERYEGCDPAKIGTDEFDGYGVYIHGNNITGIESNYGWTHGGTTDTKLKDFLPRAEFGKTYVILYDPKTNCYDEPSYLYFGGKSRYPGNEFEYKEELSNEPISLIAVANDHEGTNIAGVSNIRVIRKHDLKEELPNVLTKVRDLETALDEKEDKFSTTIKSRNLFNYAANGDPVYDYDGWIYMNYGGTTTNATFAEFCPSVKAYDIITVRVEFNTTDVGIGTPPRISVCGHTLYHDNAISFVVSSDMLTSNIELHAGDGSEEDGSPCALTNYCRITVGRGHTALPYTPYLEETVVGLTEHAEHTKSEIDDLYKLISELTARIKELENR